MDIDARWVKKRGERFYGYKDNVEICNKTKLIRNYTVCAASRHDTKETEHVLTEPSKEAHGEPVWLDAGYAGMENGKYLIDDVENETAGTVRRLMHKMPH